MPLLPGGSAAGSDISVALREMPANSGQHFNQLNTKFQSGEIGIDIIGGEVIWPAQFAANGYIADLSDRFSEEERSEYLPAVVEAMIYQGSIYGVPWCTDAGMLYYSRDLLEESGFSEPPGTWDELKEQLRRRSSRTRTGSSSRAPTTKAELSTPWSTFGPPAGTSSKTTR